MEDNSKKYWQTRYENNISMDSNRWLEHFKKPLSGCKSVLDLGCGNGNETEQLISFGCDVVSVDFIQGMVDKTLARVKGSKGFAFDMEKDDWNVFQDNQFDAVVAGLSLHYFSTESTQRIIQEIKRILKPQGILIARVNSTKDTAHGAGDGTVMEENFYIDRTRGNNKRYFDEPAVKTFFSPLGELSFAETEGVFNGKPKKVFEIMVRSDKQKKMIPANGRIEESERA